MLAFSTIPKWYQTQTQILKNKNMKERDYYPAGAYDDPNAPWNQYDVEEKEFECDVYVTLHTTLPIPTDKYIEEPPEQEWDDEGCSITIPGYTNTENVSWNDEYENHFHSLPTILEELSKYVLEWMPKDIKSCEKRKVMELVEEAKDWDVDDVNIEYDD